MDRSKQNRPPALLLTFLLMLFIMTGIWLAVNGRSANQALTMQTREMQRQFVADRVRFAVDALNKGEQGAAEKAVADAIQVQTVQVSGGTSNASAAVVAVAQELLRYDQPVYAAYMLSNEKSRINAIKHEEMNWDPLIWAMLARARERAGNKTEAEKAATEARRRAEVILKETGKQPTVKDNRPTREQADAIYRFMEAGFYFSDINRDAERALKAFQAAHELWPENLETQNAYGYTLVDLGTTPQDKDKGLLLTQRAAQEAPDSGVVRDSFGWALYQKGDYIGARRVLREAVDLEPNIAEIRYHLGMAYARLRLFREADLELSRALELRPDYTAAQESRDALRASIPGLAPPVPTPSASSSPAASPTAGQ